MSLQNFVDKIGPVISAAWLNAVDGIKETLLDGATTKAQARTALTSDLPFVITQGGTGGRNGPTARAALMLDAPLEITNGGTGSRTIQDMIAQFGILTNFAISPAEITLGIVPPNLSYPWGYVKRYGAVGDDVVDDWQAITNAISVVNYSGPGRGNVIGKVVFSVSPAYRITQTLLIPPNVILEGDGINAVLIDYSGTGVAVACLNRVNGTTRATVEMRNLQIYCSGGAKIGLLLSGGSLYTFTSCAFNGNAKYIVALNQAEIVDFNSCKFSNVAANTAALWFVNGSDLTPAVTFLVPPIAGDVTGTLTANWTGATGWYALNFVETVGGAAENRLALLTNSSTAVTWVVPIITTCNTVTTAALTGYTNRITLDKCHLNPGGGYAVLDDGGGNHTFSNCNWSGGLASLRATAVYGLNITGSECEAATSVLFQLHDTKLDGTFLGPSSGGGIIGNTFYGNFVIANCIDIVNATGIPILGNLYGGYTTGAINLSGPNSVGLFFRGNTKAITGNGATIAPLYDPACLGTDVYRNNLPLDTAATYVSTPLTVTGVQTVQPQSMEFIFPGARLNCRNLDGTNGEVVIVRGVTSTTFTAFFSKTHNVIGWTVRGGTTADQEEGTWTPTLVGSGTAGAHTYAATTIGSYQRRGNLVSYQFAVDITALDGSMAGALSVNGLPFTAELQTSQNAMACVSLFTGFTFAGAYTMLGGYVTPNDTKIQLRKSGSAVAVSTVPKTDIAGATCSIYGFGVFSTASI